MRNLFERSNMLNEPIECFVFDSANEVYPVTQHWHYFAEFILMRRGTAEMTADDRRYVMQPGDLLIVPPSVVHAISSPDGSFPVYDVIKFDLDKFPSLSSYSPSPSSIFRFAHEKGMQLCFSGEAAGAFGSAEIFSDCITESRGFRYGYDVMLRAQLYRLIYRIIRFWSDAGLDIHACTEAAAEADCLDRITEYIDSRLSGQLRVQELAEQCHLSYSAFAVQFRTRYGVSCKEYIERMRIFKAEEYLLFTAMDIGEIAAKTGFSDSSHFIRTFRKYRGITPGQFRSRRRG